jgi:hypothetical protein
LVVVFKGRTWRKPVYVHGEPTIDDLIENAGFQFRVDRIIWYERAGRPMVDLLLVKVTRRKFQPIKLGWKRG